MNTVALNTRSLIFTVLAALLLTVFVRPAAGQELNPILDAVHKFRLQNYLAINAFYNYSASRDPGTMADIVNAVNQANGLMQTIESQRGGVVDEPAYQALAGLFQEFKELMNTNVLDVKKNGYSDLRLVSELADKTQELNLQGEALYQTTARNAEIPDGRNVEAARQASLMLAQMMSQYSAFSSSSVAQVFQGNSDSNAPIDVQARNLDKLMSELKNAEANPEARKAIDSATSTWDFIRSSYIGYNEQNVSFVINRYSKNIIKDLEAAIPGLLSA